MLSVIAAVMAVALAAGSDGSEATPQPSASTEVVQAVSNQPDPNKVICVRDAPTGTRMVKRRTCRTRAQWDALEEAARRNTSDIQSKGTVANNGSLGGGAVSFGQGP